MIFSFWCFCVCVWFLCCWGMRCCFLGVLGWWFLWCLGGLGGVCCCGWCGCWCWWCCLVWFWVWGGCGLFGVWWLGFGGGWGVLCDEFASPSI
ncbi:hypothetical protein, partial [Pseudomonas syringae group genomosp. 7]|uniref:hypothetical protein n=1 Tax=Pseudomonas syringae group genomosp. 7 TaxID=251699 RepID=UPI00376FE9AA